MNKIRPAEWPKLGWYWWLHHDTPIEWTDDLDERWDYVMKNKPPLELSVRISAMRPVAGELPRELVTAREKYYAVEEKYDAAWDECDVAWEEFGAARDECDAAWEKYDDARDEYDAAREKWIAAWEKYKAAREKYDAAWEKRDAARKKYDDARDECKANIWALHAVECADVLVRDGCLDFAQEADDE